MSSSKKELEIIKNNSDASTALGQTAKCVLGVTNSKSKSSSNISSEISNNAKKSTTKEKTKKPSSPDSAKTKKSTTKEKSKKPSSADSAKAKQVRKEVASAPRRPKRQQDVVNYKEHPEKAQKKVNPPKSTSEHQKFFRMDEMRVDQKSRMTNDFEDFAVEP